MSELKSVVNVLAMEIEPGKRFLYELARAGQGRLVQVEFRPDDTVGASGARVHALRT